MADDRDIIARLLVTPEFHPVQIDRDFQDRHRTPTLSSNITLRAYEVYREVHGSQAALIDLPGRGCRGGFSLGEIIAFLYAHSFPRNEWRQRADEAFRRTP